MALTLVELTHYGLGRDVRKRITPSPTNSSSVLFKPTRKPLTRSPVEQTSGTGRTCLKRLHVNRRQPLENMCHSFNFHRQAGAEQGLPLHKAAREGANDTLRRLLQSGQHDVNAGSYDLMRPLHEASLHGHFQCVRTLLDYGAQVNIRNIDGATPLCDASSKGNVDIVMLLLQNGANVNLPLTLHSPLHEAALNNRWECLEVLLAHRANPNVSDCFYGTPLHIAAVRGHLMSAEVLLRHGAKVNATYIHTTPLHRASLQGDEGMVRMLLEHGADIYKEDNRGRTAYSLVEGSGENEKSLRKLLQSWEKTPKSLSHFCRLSIRNAMGNRGLHQLQTLPSSVPQVIKDFLQFRPQKRLIV